MGADSLDQYSINLASSCLSLFGSAAIIINYIFFANKSQNLYKLILCLSVADFGGSLAISLSQIFLFLHTYDGVAYGFDLCRVFRAGVQFFFVSSFFWTAAIALHIWVCARQKPQIPMYWFHLVCWGAPAILTTVLFATRMVIQDSGGWCTNTVVGHWVFWYAPLLSSFVWNAVIYSLILFSYHGADRMRKKTKTIKIRVSLYLIVFFTCWVWDICNFITQQASKDHSSPFWLRILVSAFMPLQGFLNFLVYGVSSRMFRHRQPKSKTRVVNSSWRAINDEERNLLSNNY